MRAVVLQCHPLRSSYNEAMLECTLRGLEAGGATPEVHRLAEGADPAAGEIVGAELLVLVHPTWWGGLPAPLLGWVQRHLGPWIDAGAPADTSPLRTVRELVSVTSHGSSQLINRVQGEGGRQLVRRSILPLCAPGARHHWISLYKLDRLDRADLEAFLDRVERETRLTTARSAA
jgi:putative NADPH-quinone reductase